MGPTRTPTPTRTSSLTSARGSSRRCRRVRPPAIPHSACHEPDTHDDPRRLVRRLVRHAARFSSRGCPLAMRACTPRVHVYCTRTISYRVHVYKITCRRRGMPAEAYARVGIRSVRLFVRTLKEKRLELSTPKSAVHGRYRPGVGLHVDSTAFLLFFLDRVYTEPR